MGTLLFYYTLAVMLIILTAASSCVSTYLVSRNRAFLYVGAAFLFYFFDITLVFLNDFNFGMGQEYSSDMGNPLSLITGFGTFLMMVQAICYFLNAKSPLMRLGLPVAWVVASAVVLVAFADTPFDSFAFYLQRALFFYALLVVLLAKFVQQGDGPLRSRLWKFRYMWLAALVLTTLSIAEDAYFMLLGASDVPGVLWTHPDRNFCENMMLVMFAVAAIRSSVVYLRLRYNSGMDVAEDDESAERAFQRGLPAFSQRFGLTARESEIVGLVVHGKDNQNIASQLGISLSTVKVHMSNILKKTGCANRKELVQQFWKG